MIGNLTYDQIKEIAAGLRLEASKIQPMANARGLQEISDFCSSVETYAKFLENTLELNKDADKALRELMPQK